MASIDNIREIAEGSFEAFIRLVAPKQVLGAVHVELCQWWTREDRKKYQLTLLPRDHGKSRMIAFRVAWEITKRPWIRVLYVSATANLAEKQLKMIKDILTSPIYRKYWPEMVHPDEGKREKWTNTEFSVDHPRRKEEGVRDPTVFTAGLTTVITGLHCDIAVLDDVVIGDNAYTEEGRNKVKTQYSYFSSIESSDAEEWVVGTRYHPKDLYNDIMNMMETIYDDDGNEIDQDPIFEKFERQVEDRGDGTGEFLWPRQQRSDGMWFGFDRKILAQKRAKYLDKAQFRAQYYNDPNDPESARVKPDRFQYYDKSFLRNDAGKWYFNGRRLNVFAAIDFAYSTAKRADYTAIVVVGVDGDHNYYVLDIDRFKDGRISEYFQAILRMHQKWEFTKLGAEVTSAQMAIVEELKNSYIRANGLRMVVEPIKHTRHEGTKDERLNAILKPKYENNAIWHYRGGNCQILEDELTLDHPPHDDVMDALASALEICVAPTAASQNFRRQTQNIVAHPRFGGVSFRS